FPCPGVGGGVVLSGHTPGCGLVLFPVVVEPVGGSFQVEYAVDGDAAQRLVEAHSFVGVPVLGGPVGGHGSPHDHFSGGGDVGRHPPATAGEADEDTECAQAHGEHARQEAAHRPDETVLLHGHQGEHAGPGA